SDCDIQNLKLSNDSDIYSFLFRGGNIWVLDSKDSSIRNTTFYNSSISRFNLNNTFIENIKYVPAKTKRNYGKSMTYETISDNYKRFRLAYNKLGARNETRECYYFERKFDMLRRVIEIDTFNSVYKFSFSPGRS